MLWVRRAPWAEVGGAGAQLASSTSAKIGGALDPSLRARYSPHLWPGQQRDERPEHSLGFEAPGPEHWCGDWGPPGKGFMRT